MSGNYAASTHGKVRSAASRRGSVVLAVDSLIKRKVWLPRSLYTLIPLFYVISGSVALASAIWLPGWSWLLPYSLLGAGICLHAAIVISIMRLKNRKPKNRN